jgi:hypothetical protein
MEIYKRDLKLLIVTTIFCICLYTENYLMGIFIISYINSIIK